MSVDLEFPVHESIHVIEGTTIYKTEKWWCAVILANMFGHNKIMIYQWQKKGDQWKRKQKFGINFEKDWDKMKKVIDDYILKMRVQ